jgi:hypothetical protein
MAGDPVTVAKAVNMDPSSPQLEQTMHLAVILQELLQILAVSVFVGCNIGALLMSLDSIYLLLSSTVQHPKFSVPNFKHYVGRSLLVSLQL